MDDEARGALTDALIREAIGLLVMAGIMWYLGPGRVLIPAWIDRAQEFMRRHDPHEGQVRQFASEVSRWEHEQATKQDRRPAAGGPCGCGGLRPPGRHRPDAA